MLSCGQLHSTKRLRNGIAVAPEGVGQPSPDGEVLFLARLSPRKRVMDFARMAAALSPRFPHVRFVVAGPDEGDLPQLRRFLAAQPDPGRIGYEGAVAAQDVAARLARCRVFVLPSVDEPFPVTVLQALSVAAPTVITRSNGLAPELAAAGAACVVEPTVADLSSAVSRLLQHDSARVALGQRGRLYANEHFSIEAVVDQLVADYESILAPTPR